MLRVLLTPPRRRAWRCAQAKLFTLPLGGLPPVVAVGDPATGDEAVVLWATRTVAVQESEAAKLALTWWDQGWGNQKGKLYARLAGSADWAPLSEELAPHAAARLELFLPPALCGVGGKEVEFGFVVGGGGGHQLQIQDAVLTAAQQLPEEAAAAPAGAAEEELARLALAT